jgi:hypothetical protein
MINLNATNTNLSGSNLSGTQTSPAGTQATGSVRSQPPGADRVLEASNLPARLPDLAVGEDVTARMVEQIDNRRFVALIKNGLFTLTLPPDTQLPGDTIKLTVATLAPSLTFTLSESAQEGQAAESSAQVQLSRSAQYLTTLLTASQDPDSAPLGSTPQQALLSKPLLLTDSPTQPAKLAEGLAHAVNKSGVFYESHVKSWAEGRLPLQQLKEEPQARLLETLQTRETLQSSAATLNSALQSDASNPSNRLLSAAAPQLGQLVQRQLDTLEHRTLFLQATAWLGQPVTMTIQEEQVSERDAQEEAPERAWTTRLALDLPQLGSVNVNLRLVNGTVQVDFLPRDQTTSQLIRDHGGRLASGMSAAGLNLAQLTVQHGKETGA